MSCISVDVASQGARDARRNHRRTVDYGRTQDPGRSRKKGTDFFSTGFTKAMDSLKNVGRSKTPPCQRIPNGFDNPSYQWGTARGPGMKLPPYVKQDDTRNQPASSSHGERSGSREMSVYQLRAPPVGSYQDDDSGPSPKNLVMAVVGVKSAVTHFAKVLMSDVTKNPEQLRRLKQTIRHEVPAELDRANHWKFLVQAFVCKRLFDGFEAENGFFGIKDFDGWTMTSYNSFADFSRFKDKAATISELLAKDSADGSFLGKYCFKKFKAITGDLFTNRPLPFYEQEWRMVERGRHPHSEFYQSFLKVAVSVWLLHRLVYSFEQRSRMMGWKTFPRGCKFQRMHMESVVPGDFEGEDGETGSEGNTVVGFLVIPGFQVSKSVVKCEVYLCNKSSLNDGKSVEAIEMQSRGKSLEKSFSDKAPATYQRQGPRKLSPSQKSLSDRYNHKQEKLER